jgi:uncharacterized protein YukE
MRPAEDRVDATELLLGYRGDDEEKPLPRPAPPQAPARPDPDLPSAGGPDGKDVQDSVGGYLDYLSQLCRQLGVPDIVEEYFAPVVGRWTAMHDAAERWRKAGKAAEDVTTGLAKPLGGLDASWEGETADSFIQYMQEVGLAGNDLSDAMNAMAGVLDKTADAIREVVTELAGVLAETAETSSQAMSGPFAGEERTRQHIDTMRRPTREFFESVRQILEAFVKLCDGVDGSKSFDQVTMAHTYPAENWNPNIDIPSPDTKTTEATAKPAPGEPSTGPGSAGSASGGGGSAGGGSVAGGGGAPIGSAPPAKQPLGPGSYTAVGEVPANPNANQATAPAAAAAKGAAPAGAAGGGMGGMMAPMMGAGMGGNSGSQEHQSKSRLVGNPEDIFGLPADASPSIIGDEED